MMYLIPSDYQSYFDFFESVTYRNYLKYIRKREDDQKIVQPATILSKAPEMKSTVKAVAAG